MVSVKMKRNRVMKAPKLRNSDVTKRAVIAILMLRTAGNLAYAGLQTDEMRLLDDVPMVIENAFTGKRIHVTGLRYALSFMERKGLANPQDPMFAEWYVAPLDA